MFIDQLRAEYDIKSILKRSLTCFNSCPVANGSLQKGKSPPTSVLDMTQNNLMVRFQ